MMKLTGALMIIVCCGWFGFSMASAHRREEKCLRELISALDYMHCELQYKLTALPELCLQAGNSCHKGAVQAFFLELGRLLQNRTASCSAHCVNKALESAGKLPNLCKASLEELGNSLGEFDLEGQLKVLDAVRTRSRDNLTQHCIGMEAQRRSYQTLGVCAGTALVILFA